MDLNEEPRLKEEEQSIIQWQINSMFEKILAPRKYSVPVYKKFCRNKNTSASSSSSSLNCSSEQVSESTASPDQASLSPEESRDKEELATGGTDVAVSTEFKDHSCLTADCVDTETTGFTDVALDRGDDEGPLREATDVDCETHSTPNAAVVVGLEDIPHGENRERDSDCESVASNASGLCVSGRGRSHSHGSSKSTRRKKKKSCLRLYQASRRSKENKVKHNGSTQEKPAPAEDTKPQHEHLRRSRRLRSAKRQISQRQPLQNHSENIRNEVVGDLQEKNRPECRRNQKKRKSSDSWENTIGRRKSKKRCHQSNKKTTGSSEVLRTTGETNSNIKDTNMEESIKANDGSPQGEKSQYVDTEDALSKLSALEDNVSSINADEMDQLMPFSGIQPGSLCVANKTSGNLISVQRYTPFGSLGSLFGPPRHIGGVWKSIVKEKP